jgi:hypothetical protein
MLQHELPVVGRRAGRHGSEDTRALAMGFCPKSGLRRSTIEMIVGALFTITPARAYIMQSRY